MGRSRRNEEPLQSDNSLSPYHRGSRPDDSPGRHGSRDGRRESGARGLTVPAPEYDSRCYRTADPGSLSTVSGEQGSLATPRAIPQEGETPEDQNEPKSRSRTHKRKNNERASISAWLKICPCIIAATTISVFTYMYDIIAFMTFGIVAAILMFVYIVFSLQTFLDHIQTFLSSISEKRQEDGHPEETGRRMNKNEDEHSKTSYSFGSQAPSTTDQKSPREEIFTEPTDSTRDGVVINNRQSHHKAVGGGETVASPSGSIIPSPSQDSHYPGRHRTTAVSDEKDSAHVAYSDSTHSDSTHPEFAAGFIRSSGLIAWGASRRGRSHIKNNTPRQDSFGISAMHSGLVAIVADGVGSTEFAEKASEVAVAACVEFDWRTPRSEKEWYDEIMMVIKSVHHNIISAAKNLPYKDQFPSTTMTAAIVTRSSKGYILDWFSVGDSAIMIIPLDSPGQIHPINRAPLVSGPTEALPYSSSREPQMKYGYHMPVDLKSDILMLATDGCFKPMYQCPGPYIKNFSDIVQNIADASHLLSAIRQDGAGYIDDITAVLISSRGE